MDISFWEPLFNPLQAGLHEKISKSITAIKFYFYQPFSYLLIYYDRNDLHLTENLTQAQMHVVTFFFLIRFLALSSIRIIPLLYFQPLFLKSGM